MKLSLVQKVFISVIVLFAATSMLVSFIVASKIKQGFLIEQKRNIAEFVHKQANQHLKIEDFQTSELGKNLKVFEEYQNEIITSEIVRVKIYNKEGKVLYSDEKELIGQKLFADEQEELQEILEGNVVANIAKADKKENVYEKDFGQLLEIYVPIYYDNQIAGIVELYYKLDLLNTEIIQSQVYLVASISIIFLILFLLLYLILRNASRQIIEQDVQLKKDIEKEKEYSSLKDEFITMSSHQLRTPANVIKWSLELLREAKLTQEQKELLESSNANNEKLIAIIDNLLKVSNIKPDYFVFEKENYSLEDLVKEVLQSKKEKINKKQIEITLLPSEKSLTTNIKNEALTTVIGNLIDNAIVYTPEKGKVQIKITQKDRGHQQFMVADTGIGIPEKEQKKVFDKFFRASNAIEQKNVGSGLSLYIVKTIIEGYGGKIWFESSNKGSKFMFEIPTTNTTA